MSNQPRVVKVLIALLVSMTAGAIVLLALGNNPPSKGPFSLHQHVHLKRVMKTDTASSTDRWNTIQIFYSGTSRGNVQQLAAKQGLTNPAKLDCHFVLCNGHGGGNGTIHPTERWRQQASSRAAGHSVIRICVIGDGKVFQITEQQKVELKAVAHYLQECFSIQSSPI